MFLRHVEHVILPESHKREKGLYISPLIAFLTPLTQISGKKKSKLQLNILKRSSETSGRVVVFSE